MKMKVLVIAFIFLVIQLSTKKDLSNYTSSNEISLPDSIHLVIKHNCYNCHSGESEFPFYAHVIPVNWLIYSDITDAREVIDFSNWNLYNDYEKKYKKIAIVDELEANRMPPQSYRFMHSGITDINKKLLIKFFSKE